jgi:nitroreductase
MKTSRPITELIPLRCSWRSYTAEPLTDEVRSALKQAIAAAVGEVPFGSALRLELIELPGLAPEELRSLGTYGIIKGARYYLAGAVVPGPKALEDYAYALESSVLAATDLGLGTCWIGGTFTSSAFARVLRARPEEIVPAISPVGHASEKRTVIDRLMRFSVGAKARKPWEELFFSGEQGKPLSREDAGRYAVPLEMVRLGPSASNKQPWRVVRSPGGEAFHFFIARQPMLAQASKAAGKADMQRLDLGIALCHFALAAAEAGLPGRWVAEPPTGFDTKGLEHVASWLAAAP